MANLIFVSHLLLEFLFPLNNVHISVLPVTLAQFDWSRANKLTIHLFDSFGEIPWVLETDKSKPEIIEN